MKHTQTKYFVSLLFFLLLVPFIYGVGTVKAFDPTPTPAEELNPSRNWQCLKMEKVGSHEVKLTTKPDSKFLPANADVYIVECITTSSSASSGYGCTTGNKTLDDYLDLKNYPPEYKLVKWVTNQPVKSNIDGNLTGEPFIWQSDGPTRYHTFWGIAIRPDAVLSGSDPVLKLGTWYPSNSDTNCASLRWDPTGIVFDSKSLEPINNVPVYIYDENGNLVNQVGIFNPETTEINGLYNFFVESGYYSLKPVLSTHNFPSKIDPLPFQTDPKFPYDLATIYRGGNFFEPPGVVAVENIPVDPRGTPYRREADITDWGITLIKESSKYKVQGGTIHPFSTLIVESVGKEIARSVANKTGGFEVIFDNALIDNTNKITLKAVKPEIMKRTELSRNFFLNVFSKVEAASTTVTVEPIPNFLEGLAYGADGNPVPDATVGIYLNNPGNPFIVVSADSKGYFQIPSQYLPPFPYKIQVKAPNGTIHDMTTSQFTAANKKYAQEKNVDYNKFRVEPSLPPGYPTRSVSPQSFVPISSSQNPTGEMEPSGTPDTVKPTGTIAIVKQAIQENKPLFLGFVFILLFAICGAAFYIYKKKKSVSFPSEIPPAQSDKNNPSTDVKV